MHYVYNFDFARIRKADMDCRVDCVIAALFIVVVLRKQRTRNVLSTGSEVPGLPRPPGTVKVRVM